MTTSTATLLFPLGRTVMTPGVADAVPMEAMLAAMARHHAGDWGDVCPSDAAANNRALKQDERLLSAYTFNGTKFWIITEWDRSATTILLPEEY